MSLDRTDLKILDVLQKEGRLSSQALAERVGLTPSPCWRRLRRLEQSGVIKGYVAVLEPSAVNLQVLAMAQVTLEDHHPDSVAEFDQVVQARPEILECHATSGQYDYMLKVICESIGAYEQLLGQHIMRCSAVHQVNTSFVLRSSKATTVLPLADG